MQLDAATGSSVYWHFDELKSIPTDGWPFDRLGVAAWDHPVWVMFGHALVQVPVGDSAWKLNLFSALAATTTAALVFLIIRLLTGNAWAAAAGAVALAVAHTFWFHAVTAQVHALNAMFMAILIWAAVSWTEMTNSRWAVLAFVAGLGTANHVMLGLTVVSVGVYLVVVRRQRPTAWILLWYLVGFTPWWLQFLRMARVAGFSTTAAGAAGFPWLGDRWPGQLADIPANLASYLGMLLYQFTPFGVALGVFGAYRLWRLHRREGGFLLTVFALYAFFSANYIVPDRFAFHIPSHLIYAVFIGSGVAGVWLWASNRTVARRILPVVLTAIVLLPIALYSAVPPTLRRWGVTDADVGIPAVASSGARDGIEFFLDPNSRGDDSAERFGQRALEGLAPHALVMFAWPQEREAYLVMRYFQLTEKLRPDVSLDLMMFTGKPVADSVLAIGQEQSGCRPLYLTSNDPAVYPIERLSVEFSMRAEGYVFRLEPKTERMRLCAAERVTQVSLDELFRKVRR